MITTRRSALLAHYADRDPHEFVQIDGFVNADEIMGRDAEGHGLCGTMTAELMHGSYVRLLIPPTADPETVVVLLLKAAGRRCRVTRRFPKPRSPIPSAGRFAKFRFGPQRRKCRRVV